MNHKGFIIGRFHAERFQIAADGICIALYHAENSLRIRSRYHRIADSAPAVYEIVCREGGAVRPLQAVP